MIRSVVIATLATFASVAPAAATVLDVKITGNLVQSPSPNPIAGLPFGTGTPLIASFRVDDRGGTPFDMAAPGGIGAQRFYVGAVTRGRIDLYGSSTVGLTQAPLGSSIGSVFVVDNVNPPGAPAALRLDQISLYDTLRFPGGTAAYPYTVAGPVPADLFLRSVNFGRSAVALGTDPTLVTSLARPDLAAFFSAAGPYFFALSFGRGVPTDATQSLTLPTLNFNLANIQVSFAVVPEPSAWLLLIAGFGLTGAALRRRRMVAECPAAT